MNRKSEMLQYIEFGTGDLLSTRFLRGLQDADAFASLVWPILFVSSDYDASKRKTLVS